MRNCLIITFGMASCILVFLLWLFWVRSLPNGCKIEYANSKQCFISNRADRVVVDSHILESSVEVEGGRLVKGKLSSGISFVLDTRTSTTKYSNGIVTINGEPEILRDLPNGYTVSSTGNQISLLNSNFQTVGLVGEIAEVSIQDERMIVGVFRDGLKFDINSNTDEIRFQMRKGKNEIGWFSRDDRGRVVEIENE